MKQIPEETVALIASGFDGLGIPYAIIGGVAVSIVSTPRHTLDVDAMIWLPDDSFEQILDRLAQLGMESRVSDPLDMARKNRMVLLRDANGVEVDISIGALPFEELAIREALTVELESGLSLQVASPKCLVVMKAIASRDRDRIDIREILNANPSLDRKWVREIVAEFADVLEAPELVVELDRLFCLITSQELGEV